jgi:hypothetical protein
MKKQGGTTNDTAVPAWMPRLNDVRKQRRLGNAAALCLLIVFASLMFAVWDARTLGDFWSGYLVIAVVALGCAAVLLVAYLRMGRLTDPVWRFFVWNEYKQKQQEKRARALEQDAEAIDGAYWIDKLTKRVARLHRLEDLDAPTVIIDNEKRMIREAIARLPPAQALSVLTSWSELSTGMDPQREKRDGDDKPN